MDRLTKPDVQSIEILFTRGQKCSQSFKLTNLMHTMSVAVSLTNSNPSIFQFSHQFSILPPLSTSSFTLMLHKPSDQPPVSNPTDTVLVRASILPTGKAREEDLRQLFSKPGKHIFKDATIPINLIGPHVAEYLISPFFKTLEINFMFSKAISKCSQSQLNSLLRIAVQNGKSDFISNLIDSGADVHCSESESESESESLMSLAVKSGNIDSLQILIESGSTIEKNEFLLHIAAAMNRVDLMEVLCLGFTDIDLDSTDSYGQTALHLAAIDNQIEAIEFLLSVGSDCDVTDENGWTPLHHAANKGHLKSVEYLLNHSIFAKYAVTKEGKTAFGLAVEKGNSKLYDCLQLGDSLHRAARLNDVHTIKSCLAKGAFVSGKDQNEWTPLHRAAFKGNVESVKILLDYGARVDLVDGSGYTPLLRAVESGHVKVAMCLLANGAKGSLKSLKNFECFENRTFVVNDLSREKGRV